VPVKVQQVLTQISKGELAQRLLTIEFALCVLVAAEHTAADEFISHIFTDNIRRYFLWI